jgi:peptidoglycan hydrolase CwlO-like protein
MIGRHSYNVRFWAKASNKIAEEEELNDAAMYIDDLEDQVEELHDQMDELSDRIEELNDILMKYEELYGEVNNDA